MYRILIIDNDKQICDLLENYLKRQGFEGSLVFGDTFITGKSKRMQQVLKHIEAVAPTDIPVLILERS